MRHLTVEVSTTGAVADSAPIEISHYTTGFSVAVQLIEVVDGATFALQYSLDGTNWDTHGTLTGLTATSAITALTIPCRFIRARITAGVAGTVRLVMFQTGGVDG